MTTKEKAKRYDALIEALAFWRDYYRQAQEDAKRAASFGLLSERIHMMAKKGAYERIIYTLERMMWNEGK